MIGGIGGLVFFNLHRRAQKYACGYGKAVISMMVGLGVVLLCLACCSRGCTR
jgi:hypothetical protein